ncbi:diacylglycerol kinase family protein [Periweissella fabalis]|uniref:Diacylglycerol kinase family protein n=1 Tax=Periweissella fabalis TaxID=1070421 RepID=A0A7X6N240_9LACO|nr:diacylglycerol kinase family protein [Periweissella fabalis]MCM0599012.1 diacylglycerol kinase family protein [Periweissella fabalis]NKZ23292.1 diacylglycerol kinase family protein [Periweissella fabalis]
MHLDSHDKQTPTEQLQINKNQSFHQSIGHAISGVWLVVKKERNMRFHILVAVIVIVVGLWLGIGRSDWLWIAVAIFSVITAEFLNTIVESIVDLVVGKSYHRLAKTAKDVAAASTLVAALFAVVIGLIIFEPYIRFILSKH